MKPAATLILALFALGMILNVPPVHAAPKGFVYKPEHIQLNPIMVEVHSNGRKVGHYPVSVFFKVANQDVAYNLCQHSPRLRDIVVRLFYDMPLTTADLPQVGKNAAEAPPPKRLRHYEIPIRKAVNEALGGKVAEKAFVFAGTISMGEGVMARLPFATSQGCRTIEPPKKEGEK